MFHQKPLLGQPINGEHPLSKGLVGCWVFNEGSGDKVNDLSGNENHGTLNNSPVWVPGGLYFDGGNDRHVAVPSSPSLEGHANISIVVGIRTDFSQAGDTYAVVDKNGGYAAGYFLWFSSPEDDFYGRFNNAGLDAAVTTTGISFNSGEWHQLIATYDSATAKIYRKGKLDTEAAHASTMLSDSTQLCFGAQSNGATSEFLGVISYIYIYDFSLTLSHIQSLNINPYAMFEDPLPIELMAYVAAGGEEHEKNLSDTINMSDASIFLFGLNRSDSIALSDSPVKNIGRSLTDSISMSDGIIKNVGLPESDSIAMSDGITKAPGLPKSDTILLSDNASMVAAFLRSLNDTVTLSDSVVKSFGTTKADTITMSDNLVSMFRAILMNLNDTINLSDGIVKNIGTARADTINISDNFSKVVSYLKSFADTITLSDLGLREAGLNKADTVTLSDSVTKEPRLSKADTITLSDSIAKELGLSRADTITLSDFFSSDAGIVWTNIIIKGIDIMSGEPVFITGKYRLP
jgi:hypothetical protein